MSHNPFFRPNAAPMQRHATEGDDRKLRELWVSEVGSRYHGKSLLTYTAVVDRLYEFLLSQHITLRDLDAQTLRDYFEGLAAKCSKLGVLRGAVSCRAGMFVGLPEPPSTCGFSCPAYVPVKFTSFKVVENALARFFEFAREETDYPCPDVFAEVQRRMAADHHKRHVREREDARYPRRALDMDELARLFRHSQHPRDRFTMALMIKTGLRSQETLLLQDSPTLRETWRSERLVTILPAPGVKRLGNNVVVIDDQMWRLFLEYFDWKRSIGATEQGSLVVDKHGRGPLSVDSMATLWAEAGRRAAIKIHPLKESPLTPHSARYTFCRLLEEAGFTPFWVARLRGDVQGPDATTRSAWTYAKRSPTEMREAYLERFPRLPIE